MDLADTRGVLPPPLPHLPPSLSPGGGGRDGGDVTLPAAACLLASARLMLESAQMSVRAARRRMSSGESGASSPGVVHPPPFSVQVQGMETPFYVDVRIV